MAVLKTLRLGRIAYDRGRPQIRFGSSVFRYAASVAMVEADDGTRGLGVTWTQLDDELSLLSAVQPALAEAIVGLDAALPHPSSAAVRSAGQRVDAGRIASAVELALWDLAGRHLHVPTYQLLGARRHTLPSYVISAEDFFVETVEGYVELARRYAAEGFKACKFHMWGDARRDIEACRAIRAAAGPEMGLMLDPAGRYGRDEALTVARAIEELGFIRFEDPLPPADAAGYRWLAPRVSVPLVVNETLTWNAEECAVAARNGTVQGFRLNVGRAGMVEALRGSALAEATGTELDIAAFVPRGGLEACLHVALASPTTRWFEHHGAMGLDAVPGLSPGFTIENGVVTPADQPGFGFRVDWMEFDKHCAWARAD